MTHGLRVAEGDRIGKTIIFAKNSDHAAFIAKRFDANCKHLAGHFARVIDYQTEYAQSLIDAFLISDKAPHIAISLDMLDTGIDVPEVVNLVFFKIVRSGLFIRFLVGMERDAAKHAFAEFLAGKNLGANQIEFINLIVDNLTEHGAMDARRPYESPFTDLNDQGVGGLFATADVQRIVQVLAEVRVRAAAESCIIAAILQL